MSTQEKLDLKLVQRLESLELRARYIVEGFLSGLNRSPLRGFSAEFAEYRHYFPGDPLRLIDWKLFGRSDRFYVKQFEEETNLQCHLVLDSSGSMSFRSKPELMTKLDYARTMAAALSIFLQRQRDTVGVTICTSGQMEHISSRGSAAHLHRVLNQLEMAKAVGQVDLTGTLMKFANLLTRRSFIVLISDFYDAPEILEPALRRLRFDHHEVIALQVLDPQEIDFNYHDGSIFLDLETNSNLVVDPRSVRRDYQRQFQAHQQAVGKLMRDYEVDLTLFRTDGSMEGGLTAYLASREGKL